MIKHLLKLVWNRKRINFLITVEIFISFIVLFVVMLFAVYYGDSYRQPLGFNYEQVWRVEVEANIEQDAGRSDQTTTANGDQQQPQPLPESEAAKSAKLLMQTVKEFDEVESVATGSVTPYGGSWSRSGVGERGHMIDFLINTVSDDYIQVMGLTITRGRWFNKEDDGAQYRPLVINESLARDVFGDEDPIGKPLRKPGAQEDSGAPAFRANQPRPGRVVGVITDFRQGGEYAGLDGYLIERQEFGAEMPRPPKNLMIKVRSGVTAAFEEKLIKRLQAIAKDWSFEIEPLSKMRESANQSRLAPLIAGALVAGFLMIMVGLGLTGVLWQNVTQRTKEIGLRRAKGATARRIHRQILAELLIIATAGLGAGVAVIVQFPLLDLTGFISVEVYTMSIVVSLAVIYALTIVCGLYPSWMATKVQPAEALHYE
jgi:putative ABC transport system permease protein